jgi:hypothetical protein
MRNKTRLAVAITAALGANFASTLVQAGVMSNVSCFDSATGTTASTCTTTKLDAAGGATKGYLAITTPTLVTTSAANSRVHVPTSGIIYASELFAGSTNKDTFVVPNDQTDYTTASNYRAAVQYEVKGRIDRGFELTFTLDNAKFASKPYPSLATNAGNAISIDQSTACSATGCELKSSNFKDSGKKVVFSVDASTSPYLTDGAIFGLMYNLTGAGTLDTQGNEVKMTAKLALPFPNDGTLVESTETVTVAKSKKATSVSITPATTASEGKLRISVATNNTKFSGNGTGFISASQGVIGFLKLTSETGVKNQTGYKDWAIGDTEKAGWQTESSAKVVYSTLQITNGQFAASKTGSGGKVYINTDGTNASAIAADSVDETNAIWNLSDTALKSLATSTSPAEIIVQADGTNQINTAAESAPTAVMTIQYVATKGKTVSESVELRKIPLDGSRCTVYNVPPTSAKSDILNLRITNPTSSSGTLTAYLYAGDDKAGGTLGDTIFENEDLLSKAGIVTKVLGKLSPWETIRLGSADIEKIAKWEGRGVMIITSTLPKLEVYTLMRPSASTPGIPRPLSNVSVGAAGSACEY